MNQNPAQDPGTGNAEPGTVRALRPRVRAEIPTPALLLHAAAWLIGAAPEAGPFPRALGEALASLARVVTLISAFAWLLDRRGVGCLHFGWDEAAHHRLARVLRRFLHEPGLREDLAAGAPHVPTMDEHVAALESLYETALRRRRDTVAGGSSAAAGNSSRSGPAGTLLRPPARRRACATGRRMWHPPSCAIAEP